MPPAGLSLPILSWTPTKKKFKPLSTKKLIRETLNVSDKYDKALSVSS